MSFTPTKEQLEELGFSEDSLDYYPMYTLNKDDYIVYNTDRKSFWYSVWLLIVPTYPQSLEDLKTLIRLLTPPWA